MSLTEKCLPIAALAVFLTLPSVQAQDIPGQNRDARPIPPPAARVAPVIAAPARVNPVRVMLGAGEPYVTFEPAPTPPRQGAGVNDELDDPGPPEAALIQLRFGFDLRTSVFERSNFDRWLYGTRFSKEVWLMILDRGVLIQLENADSQLGLDPAERAKLRMAARGDLKRYLVKVEAERAAFDTSRNDFREGHETLMRVKQLSQDGPFREGCLFDKVLNRVVEERKAKGQVIP